MIEQLKKIIESHYQLEDYPALRFQIEKWSEEKPLLGITVLDATPVYRNTMTKYIALLAAGADLTVGISDVMSHDPDVVRMLREIGLNVVKAESENYSFDLILDCAASFSKSHAQIGYVELTRSGVEVYQSCEKPVFVADSGKIKRIETSLGTGESYFRAMKYFGYNDWMGKKLVVFGSGKVGTGIITYGETLGAELIVVTDPATIQNCNVKIVDYRDRGSIQAELEDAYAVVTATGIKHALNGLIIGSRVILANMGVEDEFGDSATVERVLNYKMPINFVLDEPTHLKYIDATMALHNAGAIYLAEKKGCRGGLMMPPQSMEEELLEITRQNGSISAELKKID